MREIYAIIWEPRLVCELNRNNESVGHGFVCLKIQMLVARVLVF